MSARPIASCVCSADRCAHLEVVLYGHVGEYLAPLGDLNDAPPDHAVGGGAGHLLALEDDGSATRLD
jgi:hypothetical protein